MALRELTDTSELDDLVAGGAPVLVGFVAQACGPCLQQRPIWEALSEECVVVLVDVDRFPTVREAYDVHGLPTTALVVGGAVREVQPGLRTTRMLLELLGQATAQL